MSINSLKKTFLAALLATGLSCAHADTQWLDSIVAQAGDEVITQSDLDRATRQASAQIKARTGQQPPKDELRREVLEQLIITKLQLQRAKDQGIVIDDITLDKAINSIAKDNGMTLPDFIKALKAEGLEYKDFRKSIREELAVTKLQKRELARRIKVTDQEIDELLNKHQQSSSKNARYRLSHILITAPEGADAAAVEEARKKAQDIHDRASSGEDFRKLAKKFSEAGNATKGGDLGWRKFDELPTLFTNAVTNAEKGKVADIIRNGNSFHVVKIMDMESNDAGPREVQYRARHILIKPGPGAEKKLEKIRQRIIKGEDFGALARKYSEDPGSGTKGGELGWASASTYVPAFAEAIQKTPKGKITQPFKSRFGWHILQVEDQRTVKVDKDELRARARALLAKQKEDEALQEWLTELRDEAFVEIKK